MKVLVYSEPWDAHAAAVAWALNDRGAVPIVRAHSQYPAASFASLRLRTEATSGRFDECHDEAFDVIWNRRPLPPDVSHLHPADRDFAEKESSHFLASYANLTGRGAFQVNDPGAARRAQYKPLQLDAARRVGLRFPDTLVSNLPADIRSFAAQHRHSIIHKTLTPRTWLIDDGQVSAVTQTGLVPTRLLANDELLALCPGIYQPLIQKRHEYRITVMDKKTFVAKHFHPDSATIDGRFPGALWSDGTDDLSHEFLERCQALMEELGLVFACLDVIEPADGSGPIFLEVNEMGQWLYVESHLPHFPMLSAFCELLMERQVRPEFGSGDLHHVSFNRFKATQAYAEANAACRANVKAQAMQITRECSAIPVR